LTSSRSFSLRWLAVSAFVLSSTLNYLDRQLLNVLAPLIMADMHLNQTGFGWLISTFSIAYAASSLLTGWFLDRFGINRGISAAVSWWSTAAICTGFVSNFAGVASCRAALGVGESANVPAAGKLNGIYLKPEERALGAAVNQIGISLGLALAPLFIGMAAARTWRAPFVLTGAFGFVWIPIWLAVSRSIPPRYAPESVTRPAWSLLRERSLTVLAVANVLWMTSYSLWSNWTTLYLIHVHGLTLTETKAYVWIPPLVSNVGGFFGGWLSLASIKRGVDPVSARRKAIWFSAAASLTTLLLPAASNARWATALISVSFFFALSGSVNLYALPIDLYGPERSGLAIAALTFAFGVMQAVISPVIGFLGDHHLYSQVIWFATVPLILSALILSFVRAPRLLD
jgi:ACS family hexuronate transporter-like MFS transporter